MAKFNVVGLDDVQEAMLRQDAIVEEAVPEMLKAGGAVMQKAQQEEIKTCLLYTSPSPRDRG